jgi:hypothetical protein
MNAKELLLNAAKISDEQINLMAHALGWPDLLNIHRPRKQVRWANPYRNYFVTGREVENFKAWSDLAWAGYAGSDFPERGNCVFTVTPLGQKCTRLRLLAERMLK